MVKGMGDQSLQELLPWLLQTLTSESSSVDRSGAAQGLSEVLYSQGVSPSLSAHATVCEQLSGHRATNAHKRRLPHVVCVPSQSLLGRSLRLLWPTHCLVYSRYVRIHFVVFVHWLADVSLPPPPPPLSLSLSCLLSPPLSDRVLLMSQSSSGTHRFKLGQTIVNRYADTAVELFLPQLERGLFDENWRIR